MILIGMLFPRNLPPISRLYWGWWLPHSIRWADRIIADSEHTRQDIHRLLGVPRERIVVIPQGWELSSPSYSTMPSCSSGPKANMNSPTDFCSI